MQSPVRTRVPAARARSAYSVTRRVLPTPESPATSSAPGSPSAARASAWSNTASCSARPTKVGLDTRRTRPLFRGLVAASRVSGKGLARARPPGQRRQPPLAARLARPAPAAVGGRAQLGLVDGARRVCEGCSVHGNEATAKEAASHPQSAPSCYLAAGLSLEHIAQRPAADLQQREQPASQGRRLVGVAPVQK